MCVSYEAELDKHAVVPELASRERENRMERADSQRRQMRGPTLFDVPPTSSGPKLRHQSLCRRNVSCSIAIKVILGQSDLPTELIGGCARPLCIPALLRGTLGHNHDDGLLRTETAMVVGLLSKR